MPLPFSFTFAVSEIPNPFSRRRAFGSTPPESDAGSAKDGCPPPPRRRPSSPSLLPQISRKRGWAPSESEISCAAAVPASTSGYLETPAKHRDVMETSDSGQTDEPMSDLPPSKRRRTLVSSIAGTALSAALIGTAVGLTAYRIWKDWGKQPRLELAPPPPPPPYEQGEWVPPKLDPIPANVVQVAPSSSSSAATRSRKLRHVAGSRRMTRHHKSLSRTSHISVASSSSISAYRAPIPSEFIAPTEPEMDAEMDDSVLWMNDRLASLIAEGQRALGKEVVVMSETQEDEEDDGAGGWVEEDTGQSTTSSYARSARTSWSSGLPPYSSPSPRQLAFDFARSPRVESDAFAGAGNREDEASWQTPELREAMARARDRYKRERT